MRQTKDERISNIDRHAGLERSADVPLPTGQDLLKHLPQQDPFRYVDEVLEADEHRIVCRYTFRPDADFYRGHFPGQPVTPGVILLESMCQTGLALHSIYLLLKDGHSIGEYRTMLTDAEVEWLSPISPGEKVTISAELLVWRNLRIRSRVELRAANSRLAASGELGGMAIKL